MAESWRKCRAPVRSSPRAPPSKAKPAAPQTNIFGRIYLALRARAVSYTAVYRRRGYGPAPAGTVSGYLVYGRTVQLYADCKDPNIIIHAIRRVLYYTCLMVN